MSDYRQGARVWEYLPLIGRTNNQSEHAHNIKLEDRTDALVWHLGQENAIHKKWAVGIGTQRDKEVGLACEETLHYNIPLGIHML